ncbi:hypothetical protein ACTJKC_24855 [Pedobacter sp. 22226]|uniref:hypothetical protein n=1 Tax=Pedobacter sp. 22226 TaxID=3453894 RepID=UPI003F832A4A
MNPIEYLINLNDQSSPALNKIAESVGLVIAQLRIISVELKTMVEKTTSSVVNISRTTMTAVAFGAQNSIAGVRQTIERTEFRFESFSKSIKKRATSLKESMSSLSLKQEDLSESSPAVSAISEIGKKILELTQQYDGFKKNLSETFQSKEIGEEAMNAITQFVTNSPSQLADVVGAFDNLAKNGINPTSAELMSLGDLAAVKGKKFEDVGSALLTAQKGDFQALKQFGVEASASGDKVRLSFNGVTKTVENNGQAMKTALAEFGNMNGVAGAMEKVGNSVDDISNLKFLLEFIPVISRAFEILQNVIQPVINSVWNFLRIMLGLDESSNGVSVFTDILTGTLFVVDLISTAISGFIDLISPLAPEIFMVVGAVIALNIAMAMNPIEWIVLGIIALIAIIGVVIKYTDGWGKSWEALKTIFTLVWDQIGADFNFGIDNMVYGFNMIYLQARNVVEQIVGTFSNLGEAIGMALDGNLTGAMDRAFQGVRTEAGAEIERLRMEHQTQTEAYYRGTAQRVQKFVGAVNNLGISFDGENFSKDIKKVAGGLSGAGKDTSSYDKFARDNKGPKDNGGTNSANKNAISGITGGGTQTSHITINLAKMQDQIVINTINSGEGATKMRQLLEEELNRLLGSITLMQTA